MLRRIGRSVNESVVHLIVRDRARAEDIAQEAFLQLCRYRDVISIEDPIDMIPHVGIFETLPFTRVP